MKGRPSLFGASFRLAFTVLFSLTLVAQAEALNLRAKSIRGPDEALVGQTAAIEIELEAQGNLAPPAFNYRILLSSQGAISGSREIALRGPIMLLAGESRVINDSVLIPADAAGRFSLAVEIDPAQNVSEDNELDNAEVALSPTRLREPSADLVAVSAIVRDTTRRVGDPVRVGFTVANRGGDSADVLVSARLSSNGILTSSDPELGRTTLTLAAGQEATGEISGTVPNGARVGVMTAGIVLDPELSIVESSEANNVALSPAILTVYMESLSIGAAEAPNGAVFVGYLFRPRVTGGDGRYQYSVVRGELPGGLSLAADGAIGGIPTASGQHSFELLVESRGLTARASYSLEIFESGLDLVIATPELEPATLAFHYSAAIVVAGGEPPYQFSLPDGTLPPGLDLTALGVIDGVPIKSGIFEFEVQVLDGLRSIDTRIFTLPVVGPRVALISGELPPIPAGTRADLVLEAFGGRAPYHFRPLSTPPPGMVVTEDGHLVGTPTQVGVFAVRVEVVDASRSGVPDTGLFQVIVEEGSSFQITSTHIPVIVTREELELELLTEGGAAPITWTIAPKDRLPKGFSLEQDEMPVEGSRAFIRGSSVSALVLPFTLIARDAAHRERRVALALDVRHPEGEAQEVGCSCRAQRQGAAPAATALFFLALFLGRRSPARRGTRLT